MDLINNNELIFVLKKSMFFEFWKVGCWHFFINLHGVAESVLKLHYVGANTRNHLTSVTLRVSIAIEAPQPWQLL